MHEQLLSVASYWLGEYIELQFECKYGWFLQSQLRLVIWKAFLNQVHAVLWLAASTCLLCPRMSVYVCPPPRLLITSGVMQCDRDPYDWLNKIYGFYMAAVVGIISGRGLNVHMHRRYQPNKSKLVLYKPLLCCNNHLKQLQFNKMEGFSYKGGHS